MGIKLDTLLTETNNIDSQEASLVTKNTTEIPKSIPDIEAILNEWTWRCEKGYPDFNNPSDMYKLQEVLDEMGINLPFERIHIITEAEFDPANLIKDKYFQGFIEKISNGESFVLEKDKSTVVIDKSFLKVLNSLETIRNLSKRQEEMRNIFGTKAVIPTIDGKKVKLSDISKDTFTAKSTKAGLVGTETPDFKEGLVVFFYSCSDKILNEVLNRVLNNTSIKSNLQTNINAIRPEYYGQKSTEYVANGIQLLLTDTILDPKTKKLYLNAVSAAKAIQTKFGTGLIINRGKLFEEIRTVASGITKIPKDKWCPGDVYLYKKASISDINKIINESKKNNSIVNIEDKAGKILQVGLNSLFESETPIVYAVSLKEEEALSGRAKEFLSVKNISGEQLGTQQADFTKDEISILKGQQSISKKVTVTYVNLYNVQKKAYDTSVKKLGYKNSFGSSKVTKEPDAESATRNKIVKTAVYKLMTSYLKNFNTLKNINPIMAKYKDPFLALTAFGVSLSGFNPTFFKVVASSKGTIGHITEFKGRDSLKLETDSVLTIDTVTKAGIYIEFYTKMGTKKYRTKLDIRESKGSSSISIAIIVDEFKEE